MRIKLGETIQNQECLLDIFRAPGCEPKGAVVVLPGGAYAGLAPHEAEPVARKFVELGFHAAVCYYRVKPVTYPVPLADARSAVRYVREHAPELGIKPDKIAILGFSAGGHLAGMVSNLPGGPESRPDASILCYAVLSSTAGGEQSHVYSFHNLFGNQLDKNGYRDFCWPERVDANTPPAFLWHTVEDDGVPMENSMEYAMALRRRNIPFALHLFSHGVHGLSIDNRPGFEGKYPEIKVWPELCANWLRSMGW